MDVLNIILGILLILLGFYVLKYYEEKLSNIGGLTYKIMVAGIGLIIMGIGLIIREF